MKTYFISYKGYLAHLKTIFGDAPRTGTTEEFFDRQDSGWHVHMCITSTYITLNEQQELALRDWIFSSTNNAMNHISVCRLVQDDTHRVH